MSEPLPFNLEELFEYLDELRESGVTNMFGAAPYVENAFDCDRVTARAVLSAWMETFDGESLPIARANKAREHKP